MNYGVEYINKIADPYAPTAGQREIQQTQQQLSKLRQSGSSGMSAGAAAGLAGTILSNLLLFVPGVDLAVAPETVAADVGEGVAEGTAEGLAEGTAEGTAEGVAEGVGEGAAESAAEQTENAVEKAQTGGELAEAASNAATQAGTQVGKFTVQGLGKAAGQLGLNMGLTAADQAVANTLGKDKDQYMSLAATRNQVVAQQSQLQNAIHMGQLAGTQDHFGVGTGVGTMRNPLLQQGVPSSLNAYFMNQTNLARQSFS